MGNGESHYYFAMRLSKSWLVVAVLVGALGTGVFSYPASRKLDLAEELLSEEAEGDYQYDEVELKPDEAIKKSEVAREGSAAEPARKDDVAEAKPAETETAKKEEVVLKDNSKVVDNPESDESESPASGEEEDESPKENSADADADTGSGSAADSIESNTEKASAHEVTQEDDAEKPADEVADTPSDEKALSTK